MNETRNLKPESWNRIIISDFKAANATTGKLLWKFKVGSGLVGCPITYLGPDGRQYVAITSGGGPNAKHRVATNPELKDQANATVLHDGPCK